MRCHYVPRFYLDNFIPKGAKGFWVYDKKDLSNPKYLTPNSTAVIKNYYILSDEKGKLKNDQVEKLLHKYENTAAPIIKKIINNRNELNSKNVKSILPFLACMHCRAPRTIEMNKEIYLAGIEILLEKMRKESKNILNIFYQYLRFIFNHGARLFSFKEFRNLYRNPSQYAKIEPNEKSVIATSFKIINDVIQEMSKMRFSIYDAKDKFYITSGAPLTIFNKIGEDKASFGGGFGLDTAEVSFPLSPNLCLLMDRQNTYAIEGDLVKEINRRTAYNAERFVITPYQNDEIVEIIKESTKSVGKPKMDRKDLLEQFKKKYNRNK